MMMQEDGDHQWEVTSYEVSRAHVMNPHAQVDCCIVPERSKAFLKLGRVCICNKLQKIGNRQLHHG